MMKNGLFNHSIIRYEVALAIVGAVIAKCAEDIGDAMRQDPPDAARIKALHARQDELVELRNALAPFDDQRIEEVIRQYGPIARDESIV
ncbi:hypothetical protein WL13_00595 [Burkholderia ubonensis]|uniref:hypothetical protein n=2 Tax=Burkholderia ubonensis TaxID=101571 RepID=UPI000754F8BB|nr:hypothetical protein [Burkholderia ubonensis]KVC79448.1 hypothetical protein WI76_00220 [Burkholderia ubonensis]KVZ12354.1 hypothetical protein WL13_00595 [Burkholderia ubonensis]KWB26259.1 hypothetical protein WL33_28575 [Burkholderia ubonensis]KWC26596.1 hypothetical protein WL50_07080 [Burkholderia ubonensis]